MRKPECPAVFPCNDHFMIVLDHIIFSDEVRDRHFVCHLEACHGACCVEGESGAPLEAEEREQLHREFPNIRPFLRPEGLAAIDRQGLFITGKDGWRTPLVEGKACAYAVFNEQGIVLCGIEKAWEAGATTFRKPLSCHLYPLRVKKYRYFTAVNYDRWEICRPACVLGERKKVPLYRFLEEALTRWLGEEKYAELVTLIEKK